MHERGGQKHQSALPWKREQIKKCLTVHRNALKGLVIDDVDEFYKHAMDSWTFENSVDGFLKEWNVPTVFVLYDTMFYPVHKSDDGEREWNKALRFVLGVPPVDDNGNGNDAKKDDASGWKTWSEIEESMTMAATTSLRNHKGTISNWEEVRDRFDGNAPRDTVKDRLFN